MPNTKSAKKRHRQSLRRRQRNRSVRAEIRTRMRKVLGTEVHAEAESQLPELYSLLDRAAGRRVIHPNAAARNKARIARHVQSLAGD